MSDTNQTTRPDDHFPSVERVSECVNQLVTASGGMVTLEIIHSGEAGPLLMTAALGDPNALALSMALRTILNGVRKSPPSDPALCATCPRSVRTGPFWCAYVGPSDEDVAVEGFGVAICPRCASTPEQANTKALEYLKSIWPDSRALDKAAVHAGGRA